MIYINQQLIRFLPSSKQNTIKNYSLLGHNVTLVGNL